MNQNPVQVAFKFADWDLEDPAALWDRANTENASRNPRFAGTDCLFFSGRNRGTHSWFTLAMVCPYISTSTGDPREVPFEVAGQFTSDAPEEVFDELRNQATRWLEIRVMPTIKSALREEKFTQWLFWLGRQHLSNSSVIRDIFITNAKDTVAAMMRKTVPWIGLTAAVGVALGGYSLLLLARRPPIVTVMPTENCVKEFQSALDATSNSNKDISTIKAALQQASQRLAQASTAVPQVMGKHPDGKKARNSAADQQKELNRKVELLTQAVRSFTDVKLQSQEDKNLLAISPGCRALLSRGVSQ